MNLRIIENDKSLEPFKGDLEQRMHNLENTRKRILKKGETLKEFAKLPFRLLILNYAVSIATLVRKCLIIAFTLTLYQ